MKKRNKYFILIAVILIISIFVTSSYSSEKVRIPTRFYFSNKTAFDFRPGELTFGMITFNQTAAREIKIQNTKNEKIKINIEASEEILNNIIVSENNFYLGPNESKNVTFTLFTDGLSEMREYEGEIIITSKRGWIS